MKFRYFDIILGLFVAVVLISNVASAKIVRVAPFDFAGGTILFPLAYIFGDILTEVYGYRMSRRVIWTGFSAALLMSIVFIIVGKLPAAAGWESQAAYDAILGMTPRIVLASLCAYLAGEFSNSFILAKMKIATQGRWLWTRTIGSTIVGEGIDSTLFVLIAFAGVLPGHLVWSIIISNYIFKVGVEIAAIPATYKIISFLKKKEQSDVFDTKTNFNPFRIKEGNSI